MGTIAQLKYLNIVDVAVCLVLLFVVWRRDLLRDFPFFASLIACRAAFLSISVPVLFFRPYLGLAKVQAYRIFLCVYWVFFIAESVLVVLTIYGIYRLAMRPMQGLQRIGQIIFRWVAGVSFGLSVFFAIGPHSGINYIAILTSQVHQGVSVMALCLLLFVCLAIRPLGLTFRSHIFGVSLGLGVTAATTLIEAAWVPSQTAHFIFTPMYVITGSASVIALIIWIMYFALPEPEQRMVLLPTTSPFFMWNSISEALGDDPGFVAVSGFTPDMLSEAEIEELSRSGHRDQASANSDQDDDGDDDGPGSPLQRTLSLHPLPTS